MKTLGKSSNTIAAAAATAATAAPAAGTPDVQILLARDVLLRRRRRFHRERESSALKRGPATAGRSARPQLQQKQLSVPAAAAEGARKSGEERDPYFEGEVTKHDRTRRGGGLLPSANYH